MNETINVSVHLNDDTRLRTDIYDGYVSIRIGEHVTLFLDSHNQLVELIQAVDQASKVLH